MPNAFQHVLRQLRAPRPLRRHRHFQPAQVDCLEVRVLPTAIVSFTGVALTITGDTGDNSITLERVGNQLHVDANGGLISIQGSTVPEFFFNLTSSFNLTATFQGGFDALEITGGLQLRSANINMGDGGNVVAIADATLSGKLTILGGNDGNTVSITQTSVTGVTLIDTGESSDVITIAGSTFTGPTTIKTDGGADVVAMTGAGVRNRFANTLTISTGDIGDVVSLSNIDSKAISIDMGSDTLADVISLSDILMAGGLTLKTGGGGDVVAASDVFQSGSGANLIDLGSDTDVMALGSSSFTGATTVNLGNDASTNVVAMGDMSFGTFTLNSGGPDVIAIGQSTFSKAAKFNFGGNSLVVIGTASFLSTVSFSSPLPVTTVNVDPVNTSFARPPKLKNVLLV